MILLVSTNEGIFRASLMKSISTSETSCKSIQQYSEAAKPLKISSFNVLFLILPSVRILTFICETDGRAVSIGFTWAARLTILPATANILVTLSSLSTGDVLPSSANGIQGKNMAKERATIMKSRICHGFVAYAFLESATSECVITHNFAKLNAYF